MTREERIEKLQHLITCMKCEVSGKSCDDNCPTQYDAGNMGEVIENLEAIAKALEQEPCEDAISREDALEALCQAVHKNDDTIPCRNQIVSCLWNKTKVQDYAEEILKLPPVIPQPKTGHWIAQDIHNCHTDFKCSECDYIHSFMHLYGEPTADYTYCPNCGAKMENKE